MAAPTGEEQGGKSNQRITDQTRAQIGRSLEIRPRNCTDFLPGRHLNDDLVDGRSGKQPASASAGCCSAPIYVALRYDMPQLAHSSDPIAHLAVGMLALAALWNRKVSGDRGRSPLDAQSARFH
jgi:hypothetical protein